MRAEWIVSRLPADGRVLDVGFAGEKSSAVHEYLRQRTGRLTIVGVDLNVGRLRELKLPLTLGASVAALPFADGAFSGVIAAELLEHLESPDTVLPELARVLRPGGHLIITTPNPYELSRWLRHWVLASNVESENNVRRYLGNADHKGFIEPISFCRTLRRHALEPTELRTVKLHVPLLGRLSAKWAVRPGTSYPANRFGAYLCIAAVKREM